MNRSTQTTVSTADAAYAFASTQPAFGNAEIAAKMGISEDWAKKIIRSWKVEGRLELLRSGHKIRSLWKVKEAASFEPVQPARSPEQNMWVAMRQLKSFTPRDLAVHAATEETEVTPEAAQGYCRSLLAAEFLVVVRKAVPGRTPAIYRLTRYTGPKPPREKRVRAVIDDNTEAVVVIGGVE